MVAAARPRRGLRPRKDPHNLYKTMAQPQLYTDLPHEHACDLPRVSIRIRCFPWIYLSRGCHLGSNHVQRLGPLAQIISSGFVEPQRHAAGNLVDGMVPWCQVLRSIMRSAPLRHWRATVGGWRAIAPFPFY